MNLPRTLWIILAVSVGLRLAAALAMGNHVEPLPGAFDQVSYDALAQRVVGGHGLSFAAANWPGTAAGKPTAFWSFLYTGYLATVFFVAGHQPLLARAIQALLTGVLLPLGLYFLTRRLFGERVGLWAAGLGAVNLYFVYYGGTLMTEGFTIVVEIWLLVTILALADRPTWAGWLVCGVLVGTGALLRQVTLVPVPLMLIWLVWVLRSWRAVAGLAVATVVALAMIAPVTMRNYEVFGRLVPVNTNNGFALFWSNHPDQGTSFKGGLSDQGSEYMDMIPPEIRGLDEAALNDELQTRAVGFFRSDPRRILLLSVSRLDDYFIFWPNPASSVFSNITRVLSFGLLLPLIVYGLWLSRHGWHAFVPLYIFAISYVLVHLLSWASIRYRLPVDAALIPFAAFALDTLMARQRAARTREVVTS